MYHAAETGITVSLLYLISYSFYRNGFYSIALHRKIWNSVLAAAFLLTALAGIFMALQINYKWNIPFIKAILKWHVEIGVCLGFTGLFHFIWHLSYFSKIFTRPVEQDLSPGYWHVEPASLSINLFIVGFTSTSVQFLLAREIMNISGGYELITGIFLGSWLVVSASGAAIAGKSSLNDLRKINLFFALSPFVSLFLLIFLSRVLTGTGETPSILASIIFTLILLLPFCLVSGFAFVKLLSAAKADNVFNPGKSFSIETTGGIVSGLLISFLTSGLMNTYELLLVIILLTTAYVILAFYIKNKVAGLIARLFFLILTVLVLIFDPDVYFRQMLLPGVRVTATRDTPYGNITWGEYSGETSIYYNQRLISYADDAAEREEDIHYTLLQRPDPECVIIIGGRAEPHLREIRKYPVKNITYVERDPALVSEAVALSPEIPGFRVESRDAYNYIRSRGDSADAIIMLLPPPLTLSLNRYYTTEFFRAVRKRMKRDGVFQCSPGPGETYLNRESVNLYSSIFNSLAEVFRYVKPVSGNKLYFLASDKEILVSFCSLAEKREIINTYVGPDYLADDIIAMKSAEVVSALDTGVRPNRASLPVASFHFQSYNLSRNINEKLPVIIVMMLAFAMPLLSVRRQNLLMYFSASALAGFEIIMLLTLQLTAGNMYQLTGVVLAAVMTGLAAGAGINTGLLNRQSLKNKGLILLVYYTFAAILFRHVIEIRIIPISSFLVLIMIIIPSYITGHIFREMTLMKGKKNDPASVYSSDLAGSALGFILVSGLAIPVFGITSSIISLSILILAGFLFGTNRNKY